MGSSDNQANAVAPANNINRTGATTISVSIRYFAMLKEIAGKSGETIDVQQNYSAAQVYQQLAERYGFPLALSDLRIAINDEFASGDYPMQSGDALVFIPPVSGG